MKQFISHFILQSRMAVLGFAVLVACSACGDRETTGKLTGPGFVSGGIMGEYGPITEAKLVATDATGAVVATSEVKDSPRYQLKLGADTVYPVIISAVYQSADKAGKPSQEKVKAVVMEGGHIMVDIGPTSTRVVESALLMGGLTTENLRRATVSVLNLGDGLGSGGGGHGGH